MSSEYLTANSVNKFISNALREDHGDGDHSSLGSIAEDKIKKAVDLSVEKYCGVMEMFRQFAKVETNIFYHNS